MNTLPPFSPPSTGFMPILEIRFNILLFVFKSLNDLVPQYISDLIHIYIPSEALSSADQLRLVILKSRQRPGRTVLFQW